LLGDPLRIAAASFRVPDQLGAPCDGDDTDQCKNGVWRMAAGGQSLECAYESVRDIPERCDGQDNDCDGATDELWPELGQPCDGYDLDKCLRGTWTCSSGGTIAVCENETEHFYEACNGADDDCDGDIDEYNPEGGAACGQTYEGECTKGTMTCVDGALECVGEVGPALEVCDGKDNDCDSLTDESFPDYDSDGDADCVDTDDDDDGDPDTTDCRPKDASAAHGKVEVCGDSKDNDCDGSTDEGC